MLNDTFSVNFKHCVNTVLFSILVHFWRADYYTWSRRILQGYSHIYSDYHFRLHRARRQVRVHAEWCDKWCMIIKCIQKYDFSGDIQNLGMVPAEVNLGLAHGVWKSQKKYHSTLRAKRATFTFRVDKNSLKMPKMVNFDKFFNLKLAVKKCYQTGQL